jgi:hypothetical protein
MAPSQPIAGVEIKAADDKEAETDRDKQHIEHGAAPEPSDTCEEMHADAQKFETHRSRRT